MNAYDFEARTLTGEAAPLSAYAGRVLLIVNTASRCGFTPQYAGLEALNRKYADRGLTILAFPCNQFGAQEPGDAAAIGAFCSTTYDVTFPVMAKVEVNGDGADPLWRWLKHEKKGLLGSEAVKWNFTKFLVDRQGQAAERFAPNAEPKSLEGAIEALL